MTGHVAGTVLHQDPVAAVDVAGEVTLQHNGDVGPEESGLLPRVDDGDARAVALDGEADLAVAQLLDRAVHDQALYAEAAGAAPGPGRASPLLRRARCRPPPADPPGGGGRGRRRDEVASGHVAVHDPTSRSRPASARRSARAVSKPRSSSRVARSSTR